MCAPEANPLVVLQWRRWLYLQTWRDEDREKEAARKLLTEAGLRVPEGLASDDDDIAERVKKLVELDRTENIPGWRSLVIDPQRADAGRANKAENAKGED